MSSKTPKQMAAEILRESDGKLSAAFDLAHESRSWDEEPDAEAFWDQVDAELEAQHPTVKAARSRAAGRVEP